LGQKAALTESKTGTTKSDLDPAVDERRIGRAVTVVITILHHCAKSKNDICISGFLIASSGEPLAWVTSRLPSPRTP
jgi:hypothetical protein